MIIYMNLNFLQKFKKLINQRFKVIILSLQHLKK